MKKKREGNEMATGRDVTELVLSRGLEIIGMVNSVSSDNADYELQRFT